MPEVEENVVVETPAPDLGETVAAMNERLARLEAPPEPAPAEPSGSLLEALMAEPEPVAPAYEPEPAPMAPQAAPAFSPQTIAELEAAGYDVSGLAAPPDPRDERIDQLASQVEAMSTAQLDRELDAIAEQFPDIWDHLPEIQERLLPLAEKHGEDVLTDPRMVRSMYAAVKAEQADAPDPAAEQAASSGATLETGAGRTKQDGDDPSEALADALINA